MYIRYNVFSDVHSFLNGTRLNRCGFRSAVVIWTIKKCWLCPPNIWIWVSKLKSGAEISFTGFQQQKWLHSSAKLEFLHPQLTTGPSFGGFRSAQGEGIHPSCSEVSLNRFRGLRPGKGMPAMKLAAWRAVQWTAELLSSFWLVFLLREIAGKEQNNESTMKYIQLLILLISTLISLISQ